MPLILKIFLIVVVILIIISVIDHFKRRGKMDEDEEKVIFMEEYGLKELSAARFLSASYNLLDVITFFSIGKEEVKAWTIPKGMPALHAAGIIHSDIEKGFIRAEVIGWEELVKSGSFQAAKENAAIRLEGKDYIVQDGDVIYFRFSR